jgi:hypothetical protein
LPVGKLPDGRAIALNLADLEINRPIYATSRIAGVAWFTYHNVASFRPPHSTEINEK